MSNSSGEIIQGDKVVGYIEWQGSSEALSSNHIRASLDEVEAHWREGTYSQCQCEGGHEEALLYNGMLYFPVTICRRCMLVTSQTMLDIVEEKLNRCADCGGEFGVTCFNWEHKREWPKSGHPLRNDG